MKTLKVSLKKLFAILVLVSISIFFVSAVQAKSSPIINNTITTDAAHQLVLLENSHQDKPIYENYSVISLSFQFLSEEADSADLFVHITTDFINWVTVEFTDKEELAENNYLFKGTIGPFENAGTYYLKANASEGIFFYDEVFTQFEVEAVSGVVFLDFDYTLETQDDETMDIEIFISVIGNNLNYTKVSLTTDQHSADDELIKLNYMGNSEYNITIEAIESWPAVVHLTFIANTTIDVMYTSTDFYILKDTPVEPEDFLTSKLPAILVGAVVFIAISIIFIMAKRKPPRSFE